VISHPTHVELDFASIDSIHGAVQKQIVPDDGEASKREQQHGMQEVRRQKKVGANTGVGTSMITKHGVCIKMSRGEG